MEREELKPIVDALIFASDAPLSIQKIKQTIAEVSNKELSNKDLRDIIDDINRDNRDSTRGFFLQEVAGGLQFRTRPNYADWVKKLKKSRPFRLTQSTMESLAIIAYKQPVTKAEVDKIRGVDSGGIVKNLLERNILKIVGRKNIPGRPFLIATTSRFLEMFGLQKLSDLPSLKEFENLDEIELPTILRERLPAEMVEIAESDGDQNENGSVEDAEVLSEFSAEDEEGNPNAETAGTEDALLSETAPDVELDAEQDGQEDPAEDDPEDLDDDFEDPNEDEQN